MKIVALTLTCLLLAVSQSPAQQWIKLAQKDGGAVSTLTANKFGDLYCTALNQVYRSVDQGQSWQKLKTPINDVLSVQVYATTDSNGIACLFAFGGGQLVRSTDDGQNWQPMNDLTDSLSQHKILAFFSCRYGDFLALATNGSGYELRRSRDNGISFEPIAQLSAPALNVFQSLDSTFFVIGATTQRVNADHSTTGVGTVNLTTCTQDFFGAPVAIWGIQNNQPIRSSNKGDTWKNYQYNMQEANNTLISIVGGRNGVAYAFWKTTSDSMHMYSLEAGSSSWNHVKDVAYTFHTIYAYTNGRLVAASDAGIFSSEEGIDFWTNTSSGISTYPLRAAAMSDNAIVIAGSNGVLSQSKTLGLDWSTANIPTTTSKVSVRDLIGTATGRILCASTAGLWFSTDLGLNYLSGQLNANPMTQEAYCVQEVAAHVAYAGTSVGLLRSDDEGLTWTLVDANAMVSSIYSSGDGRFLVAQANGVYAGDTSSAALSMLVPLSGAGKLSGTAQGDIFWAGYESNGGGYTVTLYRKKLNQTIEKITIPCSGTQNTFPVWVLGAAGAGAYVNTDLGVYYVNGSSTSADKMDIGDDLLSSMRSSDGITALAASEYGAVYKLDLTIGVQDDQQVQNASLQCSPQPTSGVLLIHAAQALHSVDLFDVHGKKCMTIDASQGAQELTFSTVALSNGVYTVAAHLESGVMVVKSIVVCH